MTATFRPVLTVTPGRHPFEVGAFAIALAIGLWGLLVPGGQSAAIDAALYPWFVTAYYLHMTAWGAIALGVLTIREQCVRMKAERVALYGVGWGSFCYAVVAFSAVGVSAGQAALLSVGVSAECTYRIIQITVERRRVRRATEAGELADPPPLADPDQTMIVGGGRE